jgi:hypothetical protein
MDFPVQPKVHSFAVDTIILLIYAAEQEEDNRTVSRSIIYEFIR